MIGNAFAGRLGDLHHLHCVARSVLVGSEIQAGALGTFMCFAADLSFPAEFFDYGDVFTARSVLLRYGDVGLVAALDDSCAAFSLLSDVFRRLHAPLNPLQLREVLGHVSFVVANLQERPLLGSSFDNDRHCIWGRHPLRVILKQPPEIPLGEMMVHCLSSALAHDPNRERLFDQLRKQRLTFLFGPDGQQIRAGASASWITRSKNANDF